MRKQNSQLNGQSSEQANAGSWTRDERCLLYLMGELSPQQAVEFEQELAASQSLSNVLEDQARVLAAVDGWSRVTASLEHENGESAMRRELASSQLERSSLMQNSGIDRIVNWKRVVTFVVSVAAVALLVVTLHSLGRQGSHANEELRIAQAWVATSVSLNAGDSNDAMMVLGSDNGSNHFAAVEFGYTGEVAAPFADSESSSTLVPQSPEADEIPSWLLVAADLTLDGTSFDTDAQQTEPVEVDVRSTRQGPDEVAR